MQKDEKIVFKILVMKQRGTDRREEKYCFHYYLCIFLKTSM